MDDLGTPLCHPHMVWRRLARQQVRFVLQGGDALAMISGCKHDPKGIFQFIHTRVYLLYIYCMYDL